MPAYLRLLAWFFCCSTLLQPERCLLPYHCAYNALFMDLPVPSHSSLLTAKSVFVVGTWWLPFITEIIHNFHSALTVELKQLLIYSQQWSVFLSDNNWYNWYTLCYCFDSVCMSSPVIIRLCLYLAFQS